MKHLRALNRKAQRIEDAVAALEEDADVVALQQQPPQKPPQKPHVPMGCTLSFSPVVSCSGARPSSRIRQS